MTDKKNVQFKGDKLFSYEVSVNWVEYHSDTVLVEATSLYKAIDELQENWDEYDVGGGGSTYQDGGDYDVDESWTLENPVNKGKVVGSKQ